MLPALLASLLFCQVSPADGDSATRTLAAPEPPAAAVNDALIRSGLSTLRELTGRLQRDPECFVGQEDSGSSCTELSDRFCEKLWDENGGNQTLHDGRLLLGRSARSGLLHSEEADLQALLDARERMPKDLRAALSLPLARLDGLLRNPERSIGWQRSLADSRTEIQRGLEDVTNARRARLVPEKPAGPGADERQRQRDVSQELSDELTRLKYAESPNWKRVERVFSRAREDLQAAIESLPLSPARKSLMLERVRSARLELPSHGPGRVAPSEKCSTSEKGAYYYPDLHALTVCAGYFNSFQSDSALLGVIMHELSHSVDPSRLNGHICRHQNPLGQKLQRLKGAKGPAIPCEQWRQEQASILREPVPHPRKAELEKLYACLESRQGMIVWNQRRVSDTARRLAALEVSRYAKAAWLGKLAQPTLTVGGKPEKNEFYLRPDLVLLETRRTPTADHDRVAQVPELFTQVLACQTGSRDGKPVAFTDPSVSPAERSAMFEAALEQTTRLIRRRKEEEFSYCGRNCPELVEDNSARDITENFADWLANRGLWRHLARTPRGEARREAAAAAWALMCETAGVSREAPELAEAERRKALAQHAELRRRRLSLYDELSAGLIGCRFEAKVQDSYGACEP